MAPDTLTPLPAKEKEQDKPEEREYFVLPTVRPLVQLGIFTILLLSVLYFGREIATPICLAFILNALLQPVMRGLIGLYVPKFLAALLLVIGFVGLLTALSYPLSGAMDWVAKAPPALAKLQGWASVLTAPLRELERVAEGVQKLSDTAGGGRAMTVALKSDGLTAVLFSGTRAVLVGFFTTTILLFFLLLAGDQFLRRLIEIMPTFANKKRVVEISREIESTMSQYLMTISLMNVAVGLVTALAAYLCGMPDPILWGTLAFLLNFIPIIGPLCNIGILLLAGLIVSGSLWPAMLLPAVYLVIHLAESDYITPMLLARRLTLNPVLVILSIVFWYWMWGVVGAFLAVPMLTALKVVCDGVEHLQALGHFLGGDPNKD